MINGIWKGKRWLQRLADLYRADSRRHARLRANFQASLSGSFGTIGVMGSDVNRKGAGVQSHTALPLGSMVFLRITNLGLMGFAYVRHCSRYGQGYQLGLQFRERLTREYGARDHQWTAQRLAQAAGPEWNETEF